MERNLFACVRALADFIFLRAFSPLITRRFEQGILSSTTLLLHRLQTGNLNFSCVHWLHINHL
jgi:hypothetical protein